MPYSRTSYDPQAVHCPHCGAEPGKPCRSPGGSTRRVDHGERGRLAYGLMFPEENVGRADAERYRMKYPDVCVDAIVCAPSRAQARWWERWGRHMGYDQEMYEREHGRDTSIESSDGHACSHPLCRTATTPVATCGCACAGANHGRGGNAVEDEEFVGQPVSELLAQFDKVKVPKKK